MLQKFLEQINLIGCLFMCSIICWFVYSFCLFVENKPFIFSVLLWMLIEFSHGMILPSKDSASDLIKLESDKSSKVSTICGCISGTVTSALSPY